MFEVFKYTNIVVAVRMSKQFRSDTSGVSPVIGVILMVAITVILAAVIASFVLGLGSQTGEISPNITFNDAFENDSGNHTITLTVDSASTSAEASNILIRTDFTFDHTGDSSATWDEIATNANGAPTDGDQQLSAADQISFGESGDVSDVESGDEIRIIFETDDSSNTLRTFTVP